MEAYSKLDGTKVNVYERMVTPISCYEPRLKWIDKNTGISYNEDELLFSKEYVKIDDVCKWFTNNWRNYVNVDRDGVVCFGHWESDFRKDMGK